MLNLISSSGKKFQRTKIECRVPWIQTCKFYQILLEVKAGTRLDST
jgi:hypothetical protein